MSADSISTPAPPFAMERTSSTGRPLSEISNNSTKSDNRRSIARSFKDRSRPVSEVRDTLSENASSSTSTSAKGNHASTSTVQTITVNLMDYAQIASRNSLTAPPPPSPTTKPAPPSKPPGLLSTRSRSNQSVKDASSNTSKAEPSANGEGDTVQAEGSKSSRSSDDHISPMLMAKRASLRPSPLSASYADVAKPIPSPTYETPPSSFESQRSIADLPNKPLTKTKPSWLRRASGTAALRSKSKSPVDGETGMTASASLPPVLPPRKNGLESERPNPDMAPPDLPTKGSYANVAAGSSRSRLGDGQGRPAFLPAPPALPSRENIGNIRGRLAAWTQAANQSSSSSGFSGFSRSESSSSIATTASGQGRFPSSAQRVLGSAGSAVQKSWAGLRARGVAGSISSMSGLGQSGSSRRSFEQSGSWSSGLGSRSGRDRTQSADVALRPSSSDGPVFDLGVMKRSAGSRTGRVFGRDLVEVGKSWGVADSSDSESEYEKRRRSCLPAIVVRTVEYLEIWGPKEEGIFRISGRTSHITRLRKEFDAGADLDLRQCHPADLDPHSVAGIFKSYLRELPVPLLTNELTPRFETYVRKKQSIQEEDDGSLEKDAEEDLNALLREMPHAHWFLLADVVKLLDLIPRYTSENRMTLNALMLSLGPSLNIPGGVLTELLNHRDRLFTTPPPLSISETAASLIDFGEVNIPPPEISPVVTIPASASSIALSAQGDIAPTPTLKKVSRLPSKPSLSRLFTTASATPVEPVESSRVSIVEAEPPRVELPLAMSPMSPSFSSFQQDQPDVVEALQDVMAEDGDGLTASSASEWLHRPPITPTPIADRFTNSGSSFPTSLRAKSSSSPAASLKGSVEAPITVDGSPSSNPATVIRRGAPVFFSSPSTSHERSTSGTPSGVKRKDDSPIPDSSDGTEGSRAKRLSAGPGAIDVRDMVRNLECA